MNPQINGNARYTQLANTNLPSISKLYTEGYFNLPFS